MTNEEIVLDRLNNRWLGKSPIQFKPQLLFYTYFCSSEKEKESAQKRFEKSFDKDIEDLKSKITIEDRVIKILEMWGYQTYIKNRFQCKASSRRSAPDIWRIYRNYFGEIDIFSIMRVLYELSIVDRKLSTTKCNNVRKQVFWIPSMEGGNLYQELNSISELGVNIREWKNIGLKEEDDE